MLRFKLLVLLILTVNSLLSQDRKNWTQLDYLNADESYPFQTEKDITGNFFVTISDTLNYYENPIVITDSENKEIARIEFTKNDIVTTFYGKDYSRNDTLNPLNPWLLVLNPEYFRLSFECIDMTSDHYVIKLNDNELGYIELENRDFKKESIEDFVKGWTVFRFDFDRSRNALREEPKENGIIIPNPNADKFKIWTGGVLEMKGDWLKIKTVKDEVGWVKWKDGHKVLIRMYYAC
ncbi:hypothetical protein HX109_06775 [Galbibacter sp. BG1]|uniref:hypothetical protein n=1 Tax=Galbibacter sp. BG1 TaxID=1170699 RepID=UPI0015C191FC|nr:hypothetical protein [Galbibacter sp. BG1]QLE01284.1 hypothetical protein HX109_06775 [Galbibacter sp. BG1]